MNRQPEKWLLASSCVDRKSLVAGAFSFQAAQNIKNQAIVGADESWLTQLDNERLKNLIRLNRTEVVD